MGIDSKQFRRALGHFATGVTVITVASDAGAVHGMTANAFCSVSLTPPLVLVCVDHKAHTRPLLKQHRRFGVNILREEQEKLARFFAAPDQDPADAARLSVRYHWSKRGTPLLEDCLGQLDCALLATHEAGDHTIFVAEVQEATIHQGPPLLFYHGRYRRLDTDDR